MFSRFVTAILRDMQLLENDFPSFLIIFSMVMQPHVDFGLKLVGADLMSIPGLYRFVQVSLQLSCYVFLS